MQPRIGQKIYSVCEGYFGRNNWQEKRIEAFGEDWIIVRDSHGQPDAAFFHSREEMEECLERWPKDDEDLF